MPALRRYVPSVAPVSITGTMGTPGHIVAVAASIAAITSGLKGDAGLGLAWPTAVTLTPESATTRSSVRRTASGASPGRIRQFTTALARCGSAFSACPPSSIVATHVVRIMEL